jgi:hypothetical protein
MIVAHQQPLTSPISYASTADHSFSDSVFCSNGAKETTEQEQGWNSPIEDELLTISLSMGIQGTCHEEPWISNKTTAQLECATVTPFPLVTTYDGSQILTNTMNTVTSPTEINHQEGNMDPTKISDDTLAINGKGNEVQLKGGRLVWYLSSNTSWTNLQENEVTQNTNQMLVQYNIDGMIEQETTSLLFPISPLF